VRTGRRTRPLEGGLPTPLPSGLGTTGPIKEEVHASDTLSKHNGLKEFSIPTVTNGWESLIRLTAICWITKDLDTGGRNVGTYNGYMLGPLRSSMRSFQGHIATQWKKCRQKGIPLQAATVLGPVPAVCMFSVTRVPYGTDELATAGGIAGEPIEAVKCETVDIEVPASAETVKEGEIPTDYKEPDPACGEHLGHMIINWLANAFEIKCITHRKNPIWHDIISQFPPSESSVIRGIGIEERMRNFLVSGCGIAQVKDVAFHHCGGGWRFCLVRMRDLGGVRTDNFTVWQTLTAILSLSVDYPKIVIAVDEDIDPWDLKSVFWAVTDNVQGTVYYHSLMIE